MDSSDKSASSFQERLVMNMDSADKSASSFQERLVMNMDSADKSASSFQERLVMNMDSTEGVGRSSLSTNKSSFSIDCLLGKTISFV